MLELHLTIISCNSNSMCTHYIHHLHTSLEDIRVGEKVFMAYQSDAGATMRITHGVVACINATSIRVTWEGIDRPPCDTFTEDQLRFLAFEKPEPVITVDML